MRRSLAAAAAACAVLAGAAAGSVRGDHGVLRQFAPVSASTWWAVVASNLKPESFVVRTTNGGRTWRDVTPARLVTSGVFLGADAGWVVADALRPPPIEHVYRTLDGGRTWQRLGGVPAECQLDFVDREHGWCVAIGAAAGSETVGVYRTRDGGASWRLVSRTGLYGAGSTPAALPYGCDKALAFTSPTVGWASTYCAGGTPHLYTSDDGGARWRALAAVPLPKGAPLPPPGDGLSLPAVAGSRLALWLDLGAGVAGTATSADGGATWASRLVPRRPGFLRFDLVDVRHWRVDAGTALLATDDAGAHWRSWAPGVRMTDDVGAPLALDFLSPSLGFAVPDANDGPLWSTRDGGTTWRAVRITAGPFTLPRR